MISNDSGHMAEERRPGSESLYNMLYNNIRNGLRKEKREIYIKK